jgi:putative hydrolase of the HAD superfamily
VIPGTGPVTQAVVLDLFGTLVDAPTTADRDEACARLAAVMGVAVDSVVRYFGATWAIRHDGTLPSLAALVDHLIDRVGGSPAATAGVERAMRERAEQRLTPESIVLRVLAGLRADGIQVGVLSDASAEIAASWSQSELAAAVDGVVFSCTAGAVKPHPMLYQRIQARVDRPPSQMLYVGDGGGDELHGATRAGLTAIRVRRRGPSNALAFGETPWEGTELACIEDLPAYLTESS